MSWHVRWVCYTEHMRSWLSMVTGAVLLIMAALPLTACGGGQKLMINGIEVYARYWNRTIQELSPRASYELQCAPNMIQYTLLARAGRYPSSVGAAGCGQRRIYSRVGVQWFSDADASGPSAAYQLQLQQQQAQAHAHHRRQQQMHQQQMQQQQMQRQQRQQQQRMQRQRMQRPQIYRPQGLRRYK